MRIKCGLVLYYLMKFLFPKITTFCGDIRTLVSGDTYIVFQLYFPLFSTGMRLLMSLPYFKK